MDLGTFAIVRVDSSDDADYDVVLCEGVIPPGETMPANLLIYVKKPNNFRAHQCIKLTGEFADYKWPSP